MSIMYDDNGVTRTVTAQDFHDQDIDWGLSKRNINRLLRHLKHLHPEVVPAKKVGRVVLDLVPISIAEIIEKSIRREDLIPILVAPENLDLIPRSKAGVEPQFVLVPPPIHLRTSRLAKLGILSTPYLATFQTISDPDRDTLKQEGDKVLKWLAERHWSVKLPTGNNRKAVLEGIAGRFTKLLDAAAINSFARVDQSGISIESLIPGGLPKPVSNALEQFLESVQVGEMVDSTKATFLMGVGGIGGGHENSPSLPTTHQALVSNSELVASATAQLSDAAPASKFQGFWIEHDQLNSPAESLKNVLDTPRHDGTHVIGLPLVPLSPQISLGQAPNPTFPIALSISDLHFGQGTLQQKRDSADDVYQELRTALINVMTEWDAIVNAHRRDNPNAPAWLVLNGDILDLWSADLRDAGGNQTQPDATLEEAPTGEKYFQPTRSDIKGRIDRICNAHKDFFDATAKWIDANPMNFCGYTGGNHDDYIARFDLGEYAAKKVHETRCVFAAKTFAIPSLMALFEHGHRKDEFNISTGAMNGSSLGELCVSMIVNPIARGGASSIAQGWQQLLMTDPSLDVGREDVVTLMRHYEYLEKCKNVDENTYKSWMGAVNNIMPESQITAAASSAARELLRNNTQLAKNADVARLRPTINNIMTVWLKNSFQALMSRLAGRFGQQLPATSKELILNWARKDPRQRLGFSEENGIGANPLQRIHVVGHTHDPSSTWPNLDNKDVNAQHINTGTAIDMFQGEDDSFKWRNDSGWFGYGSSDASLTALETSQACLIKCSKSDPDWIYVYGCPYRDLQPDEPDKQKSITKSLSFDRWNRVRRIKG